MAKQKSKKPDPAPERPVNPSTDGRYVLVYLVAFALLVAVVYFTIGFGAEEATITGSTDVQQTETAESNESAATVDQ